MRIRYRQGQLQDCARIAELDYTASSGVAEFLFRDLIPDTSPVGVLTSCLEDDSDPYSYRNTIVALDKDQVVGIAISYPARYHTITTDMREFLPPERLDHLQHFFTTRVEGSYYIDGLSVAAKFTGQGIGGHLIDLTKDKARRQGYDVLSLIVFADNTDALRMYERYGFNKVKNIPLDSHRLIPHEGGCILMAAAIGD